jgi:hypothetical protein
MLWWKRERWCSNDSASPTPTAAVGDCIDHSSRVIQGILVFPVHSTSYCHRLIAPPAFRTFCYRGAAA